MKLFYALLQRIPKDKQEHFHFGVHLSLMWAGASIAAGGTPLQVFTVAVTAAVGVGVLKEALDALANRNARKARKAGLPPPHQVDFWDAAATALGGLYVGTILSLAL